MKRIVSLVALGSLSAAIACGGAGTRNSDQRSGHDTNEPTTSVPREPPITPTTIVGCLRAGEQPGTYTLVATADTPDRAGTGTSGSSVKGRPAPGGSSTTGVGGDAVRNSPTIGGGAVPLAYRLVVADAAPGDPQQYVDRQVSVVGIVEDNATTGGTGDAASRAPIHGAASAPSSRADTHTIRASSIAKVADNCSAPVR